MKYSSSITQWFLSSLVTWFYRYASKKTWTSPYPNRGGQVELGNGMERRFSNHFNQAEFSKSPDSIEIVLVLVSTGRLGAVGPISQKQKSLDPRLFSPLLSFPNSRIFQPDPITDTCASKNKNKKRRKKQKPEKREQNENKNWEYESTLLVFP